VQQVTGRAGEAGVERLVAHVAAPGHADVSGRELADFIRKTLPEYMIPSIFVVLETFPRLPNGKIDRGKLPAPEAQRPESAGSFVAPSSELAHQLAEIWQEVLGLERVGVDDSFFDLGGHSLLMAKVHDRIEQLVGRQIPIVELFQFPTIRSLERHLSCAAEAKPSFGAVRRRAERKRRLPPPRPRRPRRR